MQFEVLQDGIKDECVWLWVQEGPDVTLGAVTREALEDDAEPPQHNLNHQQLVLLAEANIKVISSVLLAKIAAGEATQPKPGDRPRVTLRNGDLRAAGVKLKTTVLDTAFGWGPELATR